MSSMDFCAQASTSTTEVAPNSHSSPNMSNKWAVVRLLTAAGIQSGMARLSVFL